LETATELQKRHNGVDHCPNKR